MSKLRPEPSPNEIFNCSCLKWERFLSISPTERLNARENSSTAPFVIVAQYPAKFHRNPTKEFVKNAVVIRFEEGVCLQLVPLPQGTDWVKNFEKTILQIESYTC